MQIYTKFGDDGDTRLLGGQTTRKSDLRVELCGQLDELNAVIGVAIAHGCEPSLTDSLARIQSFLFNIGANVAALGSDSSRELPEISEADSRELESSIDAMQSRLPELRNFILPGGTESAAMLHLGRTICRRTERWQVRLMDQYPDWSQGGRILVYLNRLGDWLFVAARATNLDAGAKESIWIANPKNS